MDIMIMSSHVNMENFSFILFVDKKYKNHTSWNFCYGNMTTGILNAFQYHIYYEFAHVGYGIHQLCTN